MQVAIDVIRVIIVQTYSTFKGKVPLIMHKFCKCMNLIKYYRLHLSYKIFQYIYYYIN